MTGEERTAIAREMCVLVRSDLTEGEQIERALLLGEEFQLEPEKALLQWHMAQVYLEPELALEECCRRLTGFTP